MSVDRANGARQATDSTPIVRSRTWAVAPTEADVRAGKSALMLGHQGPAVKALQELLNKVGASPKLDPDSKLGQATERAIVRFQRRYHLDDDGMAGETTWRMLLRVASSTAPVADKDSTAVTDPGSKPPTTPKPQPPDRSGVTLRPPEAPAATTPVELSDFATAAGRAATAFGRDRATREAQGEALLKANGQWPPAEGRYYVVQIDQDLPPPPTPVSRDLVGDEKTAAKKRYAAEQRSVTAYLKHYTGETVVFKAVSGRLVEQNPDGPFRSAAHPGQLATTAGPDVNGDGKSDIATLRSGVYQYHGSLNDSNRYDPVSDAAMKAARDLDHDGTISATEAAQDYHGGGMQIHTGNAGGPVSIGCQTLPPDDFAALTRSLRGARKGTFTYVLVRRDNDVTGAHPL